MATRTCTVAVNTDGAKVVQYVERPHCAIYMEALIATKIPMELKQKVDE